MFNTNVHFPLHSSATRCQAAPIAGFELLVCSRPTFHVSRLMFYVSCFMSRVSRLMFYVSCFMSRVSRLMLHVSCLGCWAIETRTSHVSCFTSHASPLMFHVSRMFHVSCITFHVSCFTYRASCFRYHLSRLMPHASCFMSHSSRLVSHVSSLMSLVLFASNCWFCNASLTRVIHFCLTSRVSRLTQL